MSTVPAKDNWVHDLAFEVALGYFSPEELQRKFELSEEQYAEVQAFESFQQAVQTYRRQIDEDGTEFKLKARKLASETLPVLAQIAADPAAAQTDRINAVKELCRLSGYMQEKQDSGGGSGFSVTINVGQGEPAQVVSDQ